MDNIKLGSLTISRFILGSNPFSGFSHQGSARDKEMKRFYTGMQIKQILRQAESLGITTFIGRADEHIIRILMEYWDEGGKLRWVAQTCPGVGPTHIVARMAVEGGASAIFIHGGVMDFAFAHHWMWDPKKGIKIAKDAGLPVGIAGHNSEVFPWAENHLDVDFYMCCYYNSAHRDKSAKKFPNQKEWFLEKDREKMAATIHTLKKPVIHYKVLAAGRNDPKEAFQFAAKTMRPSDAICVGIFAKDHPTMLNEDLSLFENAWKQAHPLN